MIMNKTVSNELFNHRWDEQKKNTYLTDFGNSFSGLKTRLLHLYL